VRAVLLPLLNWLPNQPGSEAHLGPGALVDLATRVKEKRMRNNAVRWFVLCVLSSGTSVLAQVEIRIPTKHVISPIEGNSVNLVISGNAYLLTEGQDIRLSLDLIGDLRDLQGKVPPIVQSKLAHNDDCDYILRPHTIRLSPAGNEAALYVGAHYEKWACPWTDSPFGRINLGKSKVFEQNGDLTLYVRPVIEGNDVSAAVRAGDVHADGVLGAALRDGLLGPPIRDQIVRQIPSMMRFDNLRSALPDELRDLDIHLDSAEFFDQGGGILGLRVRGTLRATGAQASRLLAQYLR
jgi:hypothetical protein